MILDRDADQIKNLASIMERTVFAPQALAPLREAQSFDDVAILLQLLCKQIEPAIAS